VIVTPIAVVALAGLFASVNKIVRVRSGRGRGVVALGSWALLWFATGSPFATAARQQLPLHMVAHVLVMFVVPMGLVFSGASRHWWWLVGPAHRRRLLTWWYRTRRWHAPATLGHPLLAGIALNVVMVLSHLPRIFDAAMAHDVAMSWLLEPAFFLSGVWFFHFVMPSGVRRLRTRLRWQLLLVVMTMLEMLVMAMSMSIFSHAAWYAMPMTAMGAMTMSVSLHDQQLAAAILWICGDFWAVPCLVLIVRRAILRDGSLFTTLERQASRWSSPSSVP
jgi:putative membrane protein